MRILVTGGCGFIGSNFVRTLLSRHPEDEIINLDSLTYAGNLENLAEVEAGFPGRYRFIKGDICDPAIVLPLLDQVEAVVHFAAESHVDRSIEDASAFVQTNVLGTQMLLDAARRTWQGRADRRFLYVSTDEVYGALRLDDPRSFGEDWPLDPRSPYSASKAAADHLARSYWHTFDLPVLISRCCNNYGPYQFPEKLVPLMILNAAAGKELPVYGDGLYVRDWIYVVDHCLATDLILRNGEPGQVYNVGSQAERPNLEVVQSIIKLVAGRNKLDEEKLLSLIRHVADRPGHDRRYAIDSTKLRSLGYEPTVTFEQGLARTVDWYLDNPKWCESVTSGAYQDYYRRMYDER